MTPAARREAVAPLRVAFEVSERRACSALGADRTSVRYRSGRMMRRLGHGCANWHPFAGGSVIGDCKFCSSAQARGHHHDHKKLRRIYREERLQVRRPGGRKRARARGRQSRCHKALISARAWTSVGCLDGRRRLRILVIVERMPSIGARHHTSCQRAPNFPRMWAFNFP
jgi:putative transposase